jgi:fructokinase
MASTREPGGSGVVAVAGEALVDFVPAGRLGLFEAAPGGSPANVAVGLARLGVPARLLARIADDLLGHRIRAHLAGNGVDLSFAVRAAEPTSLAIVAVGRDGVVEYDFRVQGTADWQWRDHELAGTLDGNVVALHAGSLALTMPPGADALQQLLARAREMMTVSNDPNCRPLLMGSPRRSAAGSRFWLDWPTWSRPAPTTWPGCCPAGCPSRSPRPGWRRDPRW